MLCYIILDKGQVWFETFIKGLVLIIYLFNTVLIHEFLFETRTP